jgi:hypothetical protein
MWIAVFAIAVGAAISFGVAATILQPANLSVSLFRRYRWIAAAFRPKWLGGGGLIDMKHSAERSEAQSRELATHNSDNVALLRRRMKNLLLDPDDLARSEPLLFRELETRCRQCEGESQAWCTSDLAHDSTYQMSRDWQDYCPNGAMLNMLSTLRVATSTLKKWRLRFRAAPF